MRSANRLRGAGFLAIGRRCLLPLASAGLLLLAGGLTPLRWSPLPVQAANPAQMEVTLVAQPGETFELLLRRAELVARAAVQRRFDQDILVNRVRVVILGEHKGAIAPLLTVDVERADWQQRPDPKLWATYYRSTKILLGLDQGPVPAEPTP